MAREQGMIAPVPVLLQEQLPFGGRRLLIFDTRDSEALRVGARADGPREVFLKAERGVRRSPPPEQIEVGGSEAVHGRLGTEWLRHGPRASSVRRRECCFEPGLSCRSESV